MIQHPNQSRQPTLSVVAIAQNEEKDLPGFLEHLLPWVNEIVIVNDGSTDNTAAIVKNAGPRVKLIDSPRLEHEHFCHQRNKGIKAATGDWLLHMDIDERVTPELAREILDAIKDPAKDAFRYRRLNFFLHRPMRGGGWQTWNQLHLSRRSNSHFTGDVHEQNQVNTRASRTGQLKEFMWHLNDADYQERLRKNACYLEFEAREMIRTGKQVRQWELLLKPLAGFCKIYFIRHGWRDGWLGALWACHCATGLFRMLASVWDRQNHIPRERLEEQIANAWNRPTTKSRSSPRPDTSSPALEEAERNWWGRFADVEEKICWVQSESIRRTLRGPYIKKIIGSLKKDDVIVDLGCGTGWLTLLLAEFGAGRVIGVDFSEEQINKARESLARSRHKSKVEFLVGEGLPPDTRADAVICHAFLHHLTWTQIQSVIETASKMLSKDGSLFLFEPVRGSQPPGAWTLFPRLCSLLFSRWKGLRKCSQSETEWRNAVKDRRNGDRLPGGGSSPKEMPFALGELESFLAEHFELKSSTPSMCFGHQVGASISLFSQTYPRLGSFLGDFFIRLAAQWDKRMLKHTPETGWDGWVFHLYEFKLKSAAARSQVDAGRREPEAVSAFATENGLQPKLV